MSHVVSDGLGMVAMFESLYDTDRAGRTGPMPMVPVPTDLDPNSLALDGIRELPGLALGVTRDLVGAGLGSLTKPIPSMTGRRHTPPPDPGRRLVLGDPALAPPRSPRGIGRRMVTHDVDFAACAPPPRTGGSVNDAYLAAVCATLRPLSRGLRPAGGPAADGDPGEPANHRRRRGGKRWTGMAIAAPIGQTDPAAAIADVHAAVASGRAEPAADVMTLLSNLTASLPDAIYAQISGGWSGRRTSRRAMSRPIRSTPHLAGSRIRATCAMGPLPGIALMIVMVTRAEGVHRCPPRHRQHPR